MSFEVGLPTAALSPTRDTSAGFLQRIVGAWIQVQSRPTTVFCVLSLVFGTIASVVVPPLRGPDEIAHFLRIYSYARGELLPSLEVDGRHGAAHNMGRAYRARAR